MKGHPGRDGSFAARRLGWASVQGDRSGLGEDPDPEIDQLLALGAEKTELLGIRPFDE